MRDNLITMSNELAKSLYQAVKKAMEYKKDYSKQAQDVVKDILDPNELAEVDPNSLPAQEQKVLHKEMSLSQMYNVKQAQQQATTGQRPEKMPKIPAPGLPKPPKMMKGVDKLKEFLNKKMEKSNTKASQNKMGSY